MPLFATDFIDQLIQVLTDKRLNSNLAAVQAGLTGNYALNAQAALQTLIDKNAISQKSLDAVLSNLASPLPLAVGFGQLAENNLQEPAYLNCVAAVPAQATSTSRSLVRFANANMLTPAFAEMIQAKILLNARNAYYLSVTLGYLEKANALNVANLNRAMGNTWYSWGLNQAFQKLDQAGLLNVTEVEKVLAVTETDEINAKSRKAAVDEIIAAHTQPVAAVTSFTSF